MRSGIFCKQTIDLSDLEPVYTLPKGHHAKTTICECNEYAPKVKINWDANGFRLPTEAEWQYAAEGGGGFYTLEPIHLIPLHGMEKNSNKKTHPVGKKKGKRISFIDMTGNVWEWCSDWHVPL